MVGNLMENACKWAAARVEVRVHPSGRSVAVAVEDDGPGLPPEQARRRWTEACGSMRPGRAPGLASPSPPTWPRCMAGGLRSAAAPASAARSPCWNCRLPSRVPTGGSGGPGAVRDRHPRPRPVEAGTPKLHEAAARRVFTFRMAAGRPRRTPASKAGKAKNWTTRCAGRLLALQGNVAMERELPAHLPPGVVINHNRLSRPGNAISRESLLAMAESSSRRRTTSRRPIPR